MSEFALMFTVFTPAYNRAHTLERVYASLAQQTFRDFEWLVVDDGSTDGTRALVEKWQAEAGFPIRYYWQENQGKHVAFNFAVAHAKGRFFTPLDSDDACVPHALETFLKHWEAIPEEKREAFTGVACMVQDQHGRRIGRPFKGGFLDSNSLELFYRYKVTWELWGFHRTEVLRQYPFPPMKGNYVPEATIWWEIALKYRIRFTSDVLRTYWRAEPGSSLIHESNPARHAHVRAYGYHYMVSRHIRFFWYSPLRFLYSAALFTRYSLHECQSLKSQSRRFSGWAWLLWLSCLPFGIAFYLRDRVRMFYANKQYPAEPSK